MTIGDPLPGCTCGPYWSVIPPGPCPHHQPVQTYTVPTNGWTIEWTPDNLRNVLGWPPSRKPFADGTIPQIGWKR